MPSGITIPLTALYAHSTTRFKIKLILKYSDGKDLLFYFSVFIVVFDTYPGQPKHPAGHIQIYNGEKWVSDFVQRRFWPSTAYENDYKKRKEEKREVNFKIFRW